MHCPEEMNESSLHHSFPGTATEIPVSPHLQPLSRAACRTITGAKEEGRVWSGKACEALDSSNFLDGSTKNLRRGGEQGTFWLLLFLMLLLAYCHSLFMSDESSGELPLGWKDGEPQ